MSYVPNATNVNEPTSARFVGSAAAEFREIKRALQAGGGGGGGGTGELGGITVPDFDLTSATPNLRHAIPDTNPMGWNVDKGRFSVVFDFTPIGYFTANPNAHFAVVTRCDTALLTTAVRGTGVAVGVLAAENRSSGAIPIALAESWVNDIGPGGIGNWLLPRSEQPPELPIGDGVKYRMCITSTKDHLALRYIRYQLWRWYPDKNLWVIQNDTGDILDPNLQADLTKYGLAFGSVFSPNGGWSIQFRNIRCVWGPAGPIASDVTDKVSKRGGWMDGPLTFLKFDGLRRMALELRNDNNFDFSATGTAGQLPPTIRFLYGGSVKAFITANGFTIPGATEALGTNPNILQTISGVGGPNANALSNTLNVNIDDFCQNGHVTWYLNQGNVFNASQADRMEGMIKAMCAAFSSALGAARRKGCA